MRSLGGSGWCSHLHSFLVLRCVHCLKRLPIRGTNIGLEEKLDEVFASEFTIRGKTYPALVPENQRPAFLEKYYRGLAGVRD